MTSKAIWNAALDKVKAMIQDYSSTWMPNGTSKGTADAIIKRLVFLTAPDSPTFQSWSIVNAKDHDRPPEFRGVPYRDIPKKEP